MWEVFLVLLILLLLLLLLLLLFLILLHFGRLPFGQILSYSLLTLAKVAPGCPNHMAKNDPFWIIGSSEMIQLWKKFLGTESREPHIGCGWNFYGTYLWGGRSADRSLISIGWSLHVIQWGSIKGSSGQIHMTPPIFNESTMLSPWNFRHL